MRVCNTRSNELKHALFSLAKNFLKQALKLNCKKCKSIKYKNIKIQHFDTQQTKKKGKKQAGTKKKGKQKQTVANTRKTMQHYKKRTLGSKYY